MRRIGLLAILLLPGCGHKEAASGDCKAPRPEMLHAPSAPIRHSGTRVGLALGSGSIHGLAHIGAIQELEARGLDVHVVAGTSVGAIIGSLWSSGLTGRQIEVLGHGTHWKAAENFAGSWQGLLSNDRLREALTPLFKGRPIEAWPRRFGAVATNMSNGQRRIFKSGDGALAVQASSAVPLLFLPVTIGGERFADGALVEPVPVDAARALGADFVIAIDVAYRPYEENASGLIDLAFQSMNILKNALSAKEIRDADIGIRLDLHHLLVNCGEDALIAAGREAIRHAWPEIVKKLRPDTPKKDEPRSQP